MPLAPETYCNCAALKCRWVCKLPNVACKPIRHGAAVSNFATSGCSSLGAGSNFGERWLFDKSHDNSPKTLQQVGLSS